jgi:deazaflavin-dependent oxidoreductase (nitroreductase family)
MSCIKIIKERRMSNAYDRNRAIIDEFRANEGRVGGHFEGKTLLLLHTVGAKSGKKRTNPVAYVRDGDRFVIIASKGGAPTNPGWYYNLLADPNVSVEVGTENFKALAKVAAEPERSRLYGKMVEMMSAFAEYEKKTKRVIPVITLTPID